MTTERIAIGEAEQVTLMFEGQLFLKLLDHFALVAAMPDGEDSAGRSVLRLLTPQEAIERADSLAALATIRLHRNRWLRIPDGAQLATARKEEITLSDGG